MIKMAFCGIEPAFVNNRNRISVKKAVNSELEGQEMPCV
jgi:hypothetical protein